MTRSETNFQWIDPHTQGYFEAGDYASIPVQQASKAMKDQAVQFSDLDPDFAETMVKVAAWAVTALFAYASLPLFILGGCVGILIPSKNVDEYFAQLHERFEEMDSNTKIIAGVGSFVATYIVWSYLPFAAGAFAAHQVQTELNAATTTT